MLTRNFECIPRRRCTSSIAAARTLRQQQAKDEEMAKLTFGMCGGNGVTRRVGRPVTYGLIGVSVVMALLTGLGSREGSTGCGEHRLSARVGPFLQYSGLTDVMSGQIWRLITPMFLHFQGSSSCSICFGSTDWSGIVIEKGRRGGWRFGLVLRHRRSRILRNVRSGSTFPGACQVWFMGCWGMCGRKGVTSQVLAWDCKMGRP
ncbi:MAG: hypothetical protein R3C68_05735 [Myxococcota bacterium]